MRIHGNSLTDATIWTAANNAGVEIDYSRHGSRSRTGAVEVSLRGNSKRRPNHYNGDGSYAATWDQWGVFIAALFVLDSTLTIPRVYPDAQNFHKKTGRRFVSGWPTDAHGDHQFRYAGVPFTQHCTLCTATMYWGD